MENSAQQQKIYKMNIIMHYRKCIYSVYECVCNLYICKLNTHTNSYLLYKLCKHTTHIDGGKCISRKTNSEKPYSFIRLWFKYTQAKTIVLIPKHTHTMLNGYYVIYSPVSQAADFFFCCILLGK